MGGSAENDSERALIVAGAKPASIHEAMQSAWYDGPMSSPAAFLLVIFGGIDVKSRASAKVSAPPHRVG
jgi:hypothetical protein